MNQITKEQITTCVTIVDAVCKLKSINKNKREITLIALNASVLVADGAEQQNQIALSVLQRIAMRS